MSIKDMSIKAKLSLLGLIAGIGILVIAAFVFNRLEEVIDRVEKASQANKIVKSLLEVRIGEKNYEMRRDQASLRAHEGNISALKDEEAKLEAATHDPESLKYVKTIHDNIGSYETDFRSYVHDNSVQTDRAKLDDASEKLMNYGRAIQEAADKLRQKELQEREDLLSNTKTILVALSIIILILTAIIILMVISNILGAMKEIQTGLFSFFRFLNRESQQLNQITLNSEDEFGQLAKALNQQIANAERKAEEQKQSLIDFEKVCNDASIGYLFHRAKTNYSDASLNAVSTSLNTMLDQIELAFAGTTQVLIGFAKGNYANTSANKSARGTYASIDQAMLSASVAQSEIFGMLTRFARVFNQDANVLSISGEELSTSANEQAASLEETAAAIEELTSNVSANVEKTNEMTRVAQEAKLAAEHGNTIANDSLNAMNEIVNATEAINQAVDVIDNIAFQTNILSLNAAVEAATAGDAGRGFAVVAQEVRNLANRSAEAAKQIHDLARTARLKSQNGLETSQNMMDGFALISTKIEETDSMVKDVASASREQMAGISQINDAVAQLDQMTQQNAKTAENVAQIANGILVKTEQFEQMLSRITFDTATDKQNCDINMSFETASLKMDHVNFKENTYKKLKESPSAWKVTTHHDCALGKWIDAHANESFAKTGEWNELLIAHEKVHNGTQAFIDADKSNQSVEHIAAQLEEATVGVFKGIDNIKNIHCTNSAQSHQQSHAIAKKLPQNNRQMQPSLKAVSHSTNNKPTLKSNKHITQKSDDVWESF